MEDGKVTPDDIAKAIEQMIKDGPISNPVGMEVSMPVSLPAARKKIKVYDPIAKRTIEIYEDDLQKQLYGHLYEHLYPRTFELGS